MAERSFKAEVEQLRIGAGKEFRGEGILAVTKALLQAGVAYIGGYQGAPISHLMDVFADADDLLKELGVHFETSASEAAAAAMCAASVNYPLRGVGGVEIRRRDERRLGCTFQCRLRRCYRRCARDRGRGLRRGFLDHAGAHPCLCMKSQIWLLDPRPNLPSIVNMVEKGFELSEASNTPVMLELRVRACHLHGPLRCEGQYPPALHRAGRRKQSRARYRAHRAAARELPARARED